MFQIERSDRKGRRKISFQAGKAKRSFGVCHDKPVACLPKLRSRFWGFVAQTRCLPSRIVFIFQHEQSEFLNCAAIFTTKKSKGSCTIHQLKKVMYKCALALFFARNINFEKVMCKCALFLKRGLKNFNNNHHSIFFLCLTPKIPDMRIPIEPRIDK